MVLSLPLFLAITFHTALDAQNFSSIHFSTYKIVAAGDYQASGFMRFFTGDHWRNLWITPVKVPVLDLRKFSGGLTPTKKGGGLQTKSLHFTGSDGKEYKFRSIDKDISRSLPPDFEGSVVDDFMQDQVSVTSPASSVVVDILMDAVDILHSKPVICIMPDDETLGEFREEFAGLPGTIEEDPEDYPDKKLNFAGADKIVNTFKLFDKLQEDNDELVDAAEFLKARLLDILIGDRDRHAGQWDWAGYKKGEQRIWKPIPKDRDFAFPLYDGFFPRILTLAVTSMVHFDYDMPSMLDMTWEGRHLDRRLLSSLDKPAWDSVALFMQQRITDEVIEEAVANLPQEFLQQAGNHLISKLKSRRDQLKYASDEYYRLVSQYVDIYCSDKDEYAEVLRVNNIFTEVSVYKREKATGNEKGKPVFYRLFKNAVTDEVRLHLLGGNDKVVVDGEVNEGIRVIAEGGEGKDEMYDYSKVNGYLLGMTPFPSAKENTEFYDSGKKTIFLEAAGTYINKDKFKIPEDPKVRYEPATEDRYQDYRVLVPFEYNNDDGLIFGLGGRVNYYDFRKKPFARRLDLSGSYATISQRAEFEFLGDFNDLIGGMNVKIPAKFTGLEITRFYGFGNETTRSDSLLEADYYNVNQQYFNTGFFLNISLYKNLDFNSGFLFELISVIKQENRLLSELQPYGYGFLDFFALSASLSFDNRDDKEMPYEGFFFDIYGNVYPEALNNKDFFGKIALDGRTYLSSHYLTDFTLALRAFSEIAWGEYPFYKGASIGGKKTLRGFSRDRLVGDYALLGSAELRFYLAKVYFLIPFKFGMNLFTDTGRVFLNGESSDRWHTSFGGGFWVSINERAINFSLNFARSPETFRFYLSAGQMF